jgi:DNA replication protein DnaC
LIVDDLGSQKSGEWQSQELFRLINTRLNEGLLTIFTANMPPEKLNLDQRTIDRVTKLSVVIQMPEESIRAKLAAREQEIFLREIFEGKEAG